MGPDEERAVQVALDDLRLSLGGDFDESELRGTRVEVRPSASGWLVIFYGSAVARGLFFAPALYACVERTGWIVTKRGAATPESDWQPCDESGPRGD